MRSILRFLCVVVMLQVSTPLMHGMDVELADIPSTTEKEKASLLDKPPTYLQKVKRFLPLKKIGCGLCILFFAAGAVLAGIEIKKLLPQYDSGPLELSRECPSVPWDRTKADCWEGYDADPFAWAIIECQAELMGNDSCTPVCEGGSTFEYIPVGWERKMHLRDDLNCSKDLRHLFEYAVCPPEKAAKLQKVLDKYGTPYCRIDTENGVGLVVPYDYITFVVDYIHYVFDVAPHPKYMEKGECKSLADKARLIGNCTGSFASNKNIPQEQKKKKAPKRTKGKRRTQ